MKGKQKRAVIYARFSPGVDKEDSKSSETQHAECLAYCRRKGYDVIFSDHDDSKSGGKRGRLGLTRCQSYLEKGDVLVVDSMSRVARDFVFTLILVDKLKRIGASIETVDGSTIDSCESPEQKCFRHMKSVFDEYSREVNAALTSRRMLRMQEMGYLMGRAPWGKREKVEMVAAKDGEVREVKRLVDDPAEQAVIARVLQSHAEGLSYHRIARYLGEEGVRNRKGKPIDRTLVQRIVERAKAETPEQALA